MSNMILFKLVNDWTNPSPDRREKYDWKKFAELKAGSLFLGRKTKNPKVKMMIEYKIDVPEGTALEVTTVRPVGASGMGVYMEDATEMGLVLEPVEASTLTPARAAFALDKEYGWRSDAYLQAMVMAFGLDKVEEAISAFGELSEDEG